MVFFDGKLELQGNKNVIYSGRGHDLRHGRDQVPEQHPALPGRRLQRDGLESRHVDSSGSSAAPARDSGFLIENYTNFHGSIYVVNDYYQKNNVNVCGPVIAQELFIDNLSQNCYVPFETAARGMPGAPTGPTAVRSRTSTTATPT